MPFGSMLLMAVSWLGFFVVELCMCTGLLYEAVWKERKDSRPIYRVFRLGGFAMLVVALMLCASRWGWDLGLLIWVGFVFAGTMVVVFVLPPLSRLALGVTPQSLVLGLAMLVRVLS